MESVLADVARAFRRAERVVEQRREELAAAIVQADKDGMRQVDIVRATGYTREHIRRIIRDAHS
jgi:hypothetical protein